VTAGPCTFERAVRRIVDAANRVNAAAARAVPMIDQGTTVHMTMI
jgi:hypothetical protein